MCISIKNFIEMSSNSMSCMGYRLGYLHFTLAYSKRQGQGNAHFDSEYNGNGHRESIIYYCNQTASHVRAFDSHMNIRH